MSWSDEATFAVIGHRSSGVYRRPSGDHSDPKYEYIYKFVKPPTSLMVWGFFTCYVIDE